jgi:hypothetical protein
MASQTKTPVNAARQMYVGIVNTLLFSFLSLIRA